MHEYCPPEDEINRLLAWHAEHGAAGVCPEVEATWLHHRFAQIHPFEDGNGRVARALAAAVFLRGGYLRPLVDLLADIQLADLAEALAFARGA